MHGNALVRVGEAAFTSSGQLTAVDLSVNHIEHLPSGAFAGLHQLTKLNVSANRVRTITNRTFDACCERLEIL